MPSQILKDEIYKHTWFESILCNNKLCESIFNSYGLHNTIYIGYGIYNSYIETTKKYIPDSCLKFLFIGGMNAFSRKHILEICEAIVIASQTTSNIELTCTIQKMNDLESSDSIKIKKYISHPNIKIIESHLTYDEIMNLYDTHHISIQVSKHEGLGLGFYEALSKSTPIITLDTSPHNEIITHGINGWVIPCFYKKMTDNPNGLIDSAYFEPSNLSNIITHIYNNPQELDDVYNNLVTDFIERFDVDKFSDKFIKSLN